MSEPAGGPTRYRVSYSERVRISLREMAARAKAKGLEQQFLSAVVEIDRRLGIYPQFGEPIQDLPSLPGQIWVATVPPLVVQYAVDDQRRQVTVGVPLQPLPGSGF